MDGHIVPRQVPPLPSRTYVSVTLDVDESGREALRVISLDGQRWEVTREGPLCSVCARRVYTEHVSCDPAGLVKARCGRT